MNQPAKLWKALKQVPSQGKFFDETLEQNDAGNLLNTNKGIAAYLKKNSTVGNRLAEKLRGGKSKNENPYGEHGNLFSFTEVTPELIKKQLDSLDGKKATGLDEISPQFLRDAASIVCAPLADIFNPLTSRPECMPGSRYTGVGVLFFVI